MWGDIFAVLRVSYACFVVYMWLWCVRVREWVYFLGDLCIFLYFFVVYNILGGYFWVIFLVESDIFAVLRLSSICFVVCWGCVFCLISYGELVC